MGRWALWNVDMHDGNLSNRTQIVASEAEDDAWIYPFWDILYTLYHPRCLRDFGNTLSSNLGPFSFGNGGFASAGLPRAMHPSIYRTGVLLSIELIRCPARLPPHDDHQPLLPTHICGLRLGANHSDE